MTRLPRLGLMAAMLMLMLGACGQKGPLYLPSEDPARPKPTPRQEQRQQQEEQDRQDELEQQENRY